MQRIRARQVHLDFHSSERIADLGAKLDKGQFQEALRLGHVNIPLERCSDCLRVVVPKVESHQAVVFEYEKAPSA